MRRKLGLRGILYGLWLGLASCATITVGEKPDYHPFLTRFVREQLEFPTFMTRYDLDGDGIHDITVLLYDLDKDGKAEWVTVHELYRNGQYNIRPHQILEDTVGDGIPDKVSWDYNRDGIMDAYSNTLTLRGTLRENVEDYKGNEREFPLNYKFTLPK